MKSCNGIFNQEIRKSGMGQDARCMLRGKPLPSPRPARASWGEGEDRRTAPTLHRPGKSVAGLWNMGDRRVSPPIDGACARPLFRTGSQGQSNLVKPKRVRNSECGVRSLRQGDGWGHAKGACARPVLTHGHYSGPGVKVSQT